MHKNIKYYNIANTNGELAQLAQSIGFAFRGSGVRVPYSPLTPEVIFSSFFMPIYLKEIVLRANHPWNGQMIRDLDISRQTVILMIKRNGSTIIPKGDVILRKGDTVIMYSKLKGRLAGSEQSETEI